MPENDTPDKISGRKKVFIPLSLAVILIMAAYFADSRCGFISKRLMHFFAPSTLALCDYCGTRGYCECYTVTYAAGYHKNGKVKVKYDNVPICSECIEEAKKSDKYLSIK